jgi:membrane-associated phospholipid phosphatase
LGQLGALAAAVRGQDVAPTVDCVSLALRYLQPVQVGDVGPAFRHAVVVAGLAVGSGVASGARADGRAMPTPIDAVGADLVDAFSGYSLFFYAGAVTGTAAMAYGGVDQAVRVGVQEHLVVPAYADTSYYAGYIVPATVAPGVYLVGLLAHERDVAGAGSAALQSLGVALLTMGLLKIAVGRVYPLNGEPLNATGRLDHPDNARTFEPFQNAWPLPAWPSGHTIATISVAAALSGYFPEQPWIPAIGYPLGLAIGFGMVDGDRHWASDVVAGALIGHVIGYSIGRDFRRRARGGAALPAEFGLVPLIAPGFAGVGVAAPW